MRNLTELAAAVGGTVKGAFVSCRTWPFIERLTPSRSGQQTGIRMASRCNPLQAILLRSVAHTCANASLNEGGAVASLIVSLRSRSYLRV